MQNHNSSRNLRGKEDKQAEEEKRKEREEKTEKEEKEDARRGKRREGERKEKEEKRRRGKGREGGWKEREEKRRRGSNAVLTIYEGSFLRRKSRSFFASSGGSSGPLIELPFSSNAVGTTYDTNFLSPGAKRIIHISTSKRKRTRFILLFFPLSLPFCCLTIFAYDGDVLLD